MDLWIILGTIVDFLKLLIPLAVICFILYKIFSPMRRKLAEKFDFSWLKSVLLLNYASVFIFIFAIYIIFILIGSSIAPVRTPELEFDFFQNASMIAWGALRIALSAFIITMILVFFEMASSLAMDYFNGMGKKGSSKKKQNTSIVSQFMGVLVTCAIFLVLFLFIFSWVPMGFFVFIFYGGISELPILLAFI